MKSIWLLLPLPPRKLPKSLMVWMVWSLSLWSDGMNGMKSELVIWCSDCYEVYACDLIVWMVWSLILCSNGMNGMKSKPVIWWYEWYEVWACDLMVWMVWSLSEPVICQLFLQLIFQPAAASYSFQAQNKQRFYLSRGCRKLTYLEWDTQISTYNPVCYVRTYLELNQLTFSFSYLSQFVLQLVCFPSICQIQDTHVMSMTWATGIDEEYAHDSGVHWWFESQSSHIIIIWNWITSSEHEKTFLMVISTHWKKSWSWI